MPPNRRIDLTRVKPCSSAAPIAQRGCSMKAVTTVSAYSTILVVKLAENAGYPQGPVICIISLPGRS